MIITSPHYHHIKALSCRDSLPLHGTLIHADRN